MNMTTVPSNQLKAMQQEIADLKETIAQQVEAIRLKDVALIAVRDDLEIRMRIAEDDSLNISNSVLDQMCDAIDLQPSPEILQARDEPVAYLDANYGFMRCGNAADHLPIGTKLYAVPPQPAPSVPEWQPIETAPKRDGVLISIGNSVIRAMFIPEFTLEDNGNYLGDSSYKEENDTYYWPEGWYEWNDHEDTHWLVDEQPTHWMPLPKPPVSAMSE